MLGGTKLSVVPSAVITLCGAATRASSVIPAISRNSYLRDLELNLNIGGNMSAKYLATKESSGWAVKKEGASRAASVHDNQTDAWAETRRLARGAGGEALLQGSDGRVRASNTYFKPPHTKG